MKMVIVTAFSLSCQYRKTTFKQYRKTTTIFNACILHNSVMSLGMLTGVKGIVCHEMRMSQ